MSASASRRGFQNVIKHEGVVSPYEALNMNEEKEDLFEGVRLSRFPECPTRLGSYYLFKSRSDAETVKQTWRQNLQAR